jgi:hypothetical protein
MICAGPAVIPGRADRREPGIHNHDRFYDRRIAPTPGSWGYGVRARRYAAPRKDGGAIQPEGKLRWQIHSGLMFAALMIGHHFSISAL